MENVVPWVVGVVAILLGGAGLIGLLDHSRLSLYQRSSPKAVAPERHRLLQRFGGGFLVVVGVFFIVTAVRT